MKIKELGDLLSARMLSCPHAYKDNRQDAPYFAGFSLAIDQVIEIIEDGWNGGDTQRLKLEMVKIRAGMMPRQNEL